MNKKLLITKVALFIFAIFAVCLYIKGNFNEINNTISSLSISWLIAIFTLYLFVMYNQARMLDVSSTLIQQQKVTLSRLMLVNGISSLLGNFIPSGAVTSRPFVIKKLIRIPLINSISSVSRVSFTNLFANLILLSLIAGYFLPMSIFVNICLVALVFSAYYFSTYSKLIFKMGVMNKIVKKTRTLINPETRKNSALLMIHCIIQIVFLGLIFWSYLIAVGDESPFLKALAISVAGNLSMLVAITPGNLGIKEGVYYLLSQKLAINPDVVVNILLIDRLIQITCLIIVSSVCSILYKKHDQ